MSAQAHRSDPKILGRRTLERDHRILAGLLRPGVAVLDVGCGTGAITSGIARAVGADGRVVGVDRDESHLRLAREEYAGLTNLSFEQGDATSLSYGAEFDIVTSARTLQWIAQPERAVVAMRQAVKPGGTVVILDYSHSKNEWSPEPPREFLIFYRAFLEWRRVNEWDNSMGEHLPAMFHDTGLIAVDSHAQNEVAERGDPDFAEQVAIWSGVIDHVGDPIAAGGFCTYGEVQDARAHYDAFVQTDLLKQTLALSAITGKRPISRR